MTYGRSPLSEHYVPYKQEALTVSYACRHKHRLPYALVTQDFANQLGKVQEATMLKREGARGKSLGKAAQMLPEDVMENWPTVTSFPVFRSSSMPAALQIPFQRDQKHLTAAVLWCLCNVLLASDIYNVCLTSNM